jgi:hypothetical protein
MAFVGALWLLMRSLNHREGGPLRAAVNQLCSDGLMPQELAIGNKNAPD